MNGNIHRRKRLVGCNSLSISALKMGTSNGKEKTNIVLDFNLFQPANFFAGILPIDKLKDRSKVQWSNRKCGGHRPWRRCFRKCCRTGKESLGKTTNQFAGNRANTEQSLTSILLFLTIEPNVLITGVQQLLHFVRCLRSILRPR